MKYLFIILSILLFSCKNANERSCFKFSGNAITITRKIIQPDVITVFDNIDITIYQSNRNEIEMTAGENLLKFIEIKEENGKLQIANKNRCNFLRNERVKIKITMYISNFSFLTNEGNGNISIPEKFTTTKLRFHNYGYGDLDINVSLSDSLTLALSSGNENIVKGDVYNFYVYAIGENKLNALDLNQVKAGAIVAFTNTDFYMAVDSIFSVDQVGKGTVYYRGNPRIVTRTPNAKIVKLE
jgi:Putative auto-transporter adhesin, head GIN domain